MNDETLAQVLGSLRTARMAEPASDRVREQLETAWRERVARPRRRFFAIPQVARVAAIAVCVIALGYGVMHGGADSPFYAARIAVEDALVVVQSDPAAYVNEVYTERVEEASRLEAIGNALAASRARVATEDALRLLRQVAPQPSDDQPEPSPSASTAIAVPIVSPTPDATVGPSESPSPTPSAPTPTVPPSTTRAPTPKPTATPSPKPTTPKPTVSPTPSPMLVEAVGEVVYADGSPVDGACVSTVLDGTCVAGSINGKVDMHFYARKGQTITLYFRNYDASRGGTLHGKVTVTVEGPTVLLGSVMLR